MLIYFFKYASWVLTPLHVLVCFILIAVVLMQAGKGADFAGVFGGGGGTQAAFGPRGVENTLSRATKYSAILFMVTSLGLSLVGSKASNSDALEKLLKDAPVKTKVPADAAKPAGSEAGASEAAVPAAASDAPAAPAPAAAQPAAEQAAPAQPSPETP